jgi:hypothetical protein
MKEFFVEKKFGKDALELVGVVNAVLADYGAQGYDLSLRQLYYQLVAKNIVPNTEKSYKRVGSIVSDARLAGLVDWDMIRDRGRSTLSNPHWEDPAHFMESAAPQYRIDLWEDQPCYVEVFVEKQALEGVLEPVCRELDIPFTSNKGYSSSSAMYDAGKRFVRAAGTGKELHAIYLGDHDPSGIDMTRDVGERLETFLDGMAWRIGGSDNRRVEVHRIALNMDQVEELDLPENPAKLTDSRAVDYISRFGSSSWELDAIEPSMLASLVERAVRRLMDVDAYEERQARMDKERRLLLDFAKTFKGRQ